jgi:hypothetical protein
VDPTLPYTIAMMGRRLLAVLVVGLGASVVACGGDDKSDPKTNTNEIEGAPLGPDGKPLPTVLDGSYELSSNIDLTTTGLLPDVANTTLKDLSNFKDKPAETFVDLADAAKVPVVSNVIDVIPGPLKDLVLGYIDDAIVKSLYQNVPVTANIAGMIDDLAGIATKFELVTTLALPVGDEVGNSKATHSVTGIAWTFGTSRHVINAPDAVSKIGTASVSANAVPLEKLSPKLETGRLEVGNHAFKLPLGTFAVQAADLLAKDKLGANDLRDALGKFIDCKGVANAVAGKCVGISPAQVCVGHETEIEGMCTGGLDLLVKQVQSSLEGLDIPLLSFDQGDAKMWDAPTDGGALDGIVDRLDSGFWIAQTKGGEKMAYPFTGKRIASANAPASSPK